MGLRFEDSVPRKAKHHAAVKIAPTSISEITLNFASETLQTVWNEKLAAKQINPISSALDLSKSL